MNAESIGKLVGQILNLCVGIACAMWLVGKGFDWLPTALMWWTAVMSLLNVGIALGETASRPKLNVDAIAFLAALKKAQEEREGR